MIGPADGAVTGDDDVDIARHALEQPQRVEVVLDRVRRAGHVEHRDQDVGEHVAGDEDAARLDHQGRVTGGVRPVLEDPAAAGARAQSARSYSGGWLDQVQARLARGRY